MTQPEYGDDDQNFEPDEQDDQQQPEGRDWKNLRSKAKKYDSLNTETEQLRRENAFLKAGIPDTPAGRLLLKAYDGESTPEAIRTFAAEYGVIDASDQIPADEAAALDRADAAGSQGGYTPPRPPDMNAALRQATGRR